MITKTGKIQEIDALRVLFMLMVFAEHALGPRFGNCGSCGVTAFFIISGFCMMLGYADKVLQPTFCYKRFLLKRAVRFYPIHWIALIVAWGAGAHFSISYTLGFFGKIGLNLALLQTWIPLSKVYFAFNSPSWYLCNILFFAAVFPLMVRLLQKLSLKVNVVVILLLCAAYIVVLRQVGEKYWNAFFYVQPIVRLIDCYMGMSLARLFLRMRDNKSIMDKLSKNVICIDLTICILIAIAIFQALDSTIWNLIYMASVWPTLSALLLLVALRGCIERSTWINRMLCSKPIRFAGALSFSFYMFHAPTIWLTKSIMSGNLCANYLIQGGYACSLRLLWHT